MYGDQSGEFVCGSWGLKGQRWKKGQEIFRGCLKLVNVVQDQVELKKFYSEWKDIMGRGQGKLKNVKPHSFTYQWGKHSKNSNV